MSEIAKMWTVTPPEPENLYPPNKPVIKVLLLTDVGIFFLYIFWLLF